MRLELVPFSPTTCSCGEEMPCDRQRVWRIVCLMPCRCSKCLRYEEHEFLREPPVLARLGIGSSSDVYVHSSP